jgi:hypothetical protein
MAAVWSSGSPQPASVTVRRGVDGERSVRRVATGRAIRLVLIVLVTIGVVGMHTLGHPSETDHGIGGGTAMTVHDSFAGAHQPFAVRYDATHVTTAVSPLRVGTGGSDMTMDPFNVCLAILGVGLIAALLVALLRGFSSSPVRTGRSPGAGVSLGRAPPPCRTLGLLLADLSVLRT